MEILRKLQYILKRSTVRKSVFILLFLLAAVSSFLEVLPSDIIGQFSDRLVMGVSPKTVLSWCLLYFLVVAVGAVVRNVFCYLTSRVSNTLIRDIRNLAFAKLLTVDMSGLQNPDSGYFVNMINGNCARLETVFSVALFTLVSDVFDLFWISVFICAIDWKLLLIMAAFVPVLYLLGVRSSKMQRALAVQRIDIESGIISKINETFTNRPAIRVFGGEKRECGGFEQYSGDYRRKSNRADGTLSFFYIAEKSIRYIAISLVILITAMEILKGRYPVGSLLSIVLYNQKFYAPITNIIRYIQMLQKGMASVDSLQDFLEKADMEGNLRFSGSTKFAAVDGAEVVAQGKNILTSTSFSLEDCTLNIITGPSGCGKSTLLKVLLGEQKLRRGAVMVSEQLNGEDLFSYASQDTEIFSGTILENVLYPGTPDTVPHEAVEKAKSLLSALGFSPDQWDRTPGEAGSTLSGGEKKRIAFARAVLKPARILILDEITSNLDPANEARIAQMIAQESRRRCVLLVTHKDHPAYAQADTHYIKLRTCTAE